jgi:hypothetical protein
MYLCIFGPSALQECHKNPPSVQTATGSAHAVLTWVEKILIYQYHGLINKRGARAFCGSPESIALHEDYMNWLHLRATKTTS